MSAAGKRLIAAAEEAISLTRDEAAMERVIAKWQASINERYPVIGKGKLVPIEEPE